MNTETLNAMLQPMTVVGCLIAGFALKELLPKQTKYIPLIALSVLLNGFISVEFTILGGALSGLASTGFHQMFYQFIKNEDKPTEDQTYNELNEEGE